MVADPSLQAATFITDSHVGHRTASRSQSDDLRVAHVGRQTVLQPSFFLVKRFSDISPGDCGIMHRAGELLHTSNTGIDRDER